MKAVSNLGRSWRTQAALVVVPLTIFALSLVGVTAHPALGIESARQQCEQAHERQSRFEHESTERARYDGASLDQRLAAGVHYVRGLFPAGLGAVELHSLVRLAAARVDLHLDSVGIDVSERTGMEQIEDALGLRRISLRGHGSLRSLSDLVWRLRCAGIPVAVLDLDLKREDGRSREFAISVTLGSLESMPVDLTAQEQSGAPAPQEAPQESPP
jgi:hypothetical protein